MAMSSYGDFFARRKQRGPSKSIVCKHCGTKFDVKFSRHNKAKFCSQTCKTDWERANERNIFSARSKLNRLTTFKGRHHTEETKKKMRLAQLGKIFSEEHRRNLSLAKTGIKASEETKRLLSLKRMGNKNRKGIPHSEETKQKIREHTKRFFLEHPERHGNFTMARGQKHGLGYISKGQYELFAMTKKVFPDAVLNQPLKTGSDHLYYPDITIQSIKTIVEYDGHYWHSGKKASEKDKIRDFNLQANGWKVIHVNDKVAHSFDAQAIWSDPEVDYIQQRLI